MASDTPHPIPVGSWRQPLAPVGQRIDHVHNVRQLAWLLDSAIPIPGTRFRVGLDALLGLLPGLGDAIGMLISTYIVVAGAQVGIPRSVLLRMVANVGLDALLGAVPFVGDLLDVAWRANARNARLLEEAMADPKRTGRASTWTLVGLALAVVLITAAGLALTVGLVVLLVRYLG